jgi:hypothetical protein
VMRQGQSDMGIFPDACTDINFSKKNNIYGGLMLQKDMYVIILL